MAYTKKTWVTGETIQAVDLNHLESGVEAISANGAIGTSNLANAAVTSSKIANNSITEDELSDGAVVTTKIADGAVTSAKIATAAVSGTQIASETITAENITDETLTEAKLDPTFAASLAKVDGSYEGMTVGNAEQLVSTVGVEDSAPYTFRTTGGSADVGDRMNLNTVVGGTVAWNQLVQTSDTSVTVTSGHKYLSRINGTNTIAISNGSAISINDGTKDNVFDLTAMFGSTIADYVYTLESGTAGAGIAWLKKYGYFTKPYYPYKAAALESVKTSAHKTIGFNQWDEEWELGYYDQYGAAAAGSSNIRCKNYIRVLPNTTYYLKTGGAAMYVCEYDASKAFIPNSRTGWTDHLITTGANTYYLRFNMAGAYGTTYKNDICISISWDGERDGEYLPYEAHEYALSDITLRGMLRLDANNNLYADGDRYLPDGTVERRYAVTTFDGSENGWSWYSSYNQAYIALPSAAKYDQYAVSYICDKLQAVYPSARPSNIGNFAALVSNGASVAFSAPNCDTLEKFKTWLGSNNVTFVYELATPTTETADAYTELQICNDFGTEEFVDAATRDFDMPVGNVAVYAPNLRAKLEMAPNSPDGDGDYLIRQTNGVNEYVLFSEVKELPDMPTTDGNYKLRCTVSGGTATLTWVSE